MESDVPGAAGANGIEIETNGRMLDLAGLPRLAEEVRALRERPPAGLHVDLATT